MSNHVPNQFVPQTGQVIASAQVDQNFEYVDAALDDLQNQIGPDGGERTVNSHDGFVLRPYYSGIQAPTGTDFIDFKYLMACRGCNIGDAIISINPNAMPNDYGIVWAQFQGQQLSKTTYATFYSYCQTIGGTDTGRYNPDAAGAAAGNFWAPDLRGCAIAPLLGSGSTMPATVPNVAAANWLASVVGEGAHTMTLAELVTHHHDQQVPSSDGAGQNYNGTGDGPVTTSTGDTGSSTPFNIVQKTGMVNLWFRIA
jgi:hypothetical protein